MGDPRRRTPRVDAVLADERVAAHAGPKTGEMDYIIKVVVPNLKALSAFVNDVLLPHESVSHVKTAIVLDTLKETTGLPL